MFSADHWSKLHILALVLEDQKKTTSSTDGMQTSVLTSELLKHRIKLVEEQRLAQMERAIEQKDFNEMAKLAMQDSNSFHAVCMDTYPPLFYLNDKSKQIIRFIHEYNKFDKQEFIKAFYSFDAGPNAFLFVLEPHLMELLYLIRFIYFKNLNEEQFNKVLNKKSDFNYSSDILDSSRRSLLQNHFVNFNQLNQENSIKYIIHSRIGDEPSVHLNDWSRSLLNQFGNPLE